jgi:hypothetical protein
MDIETAVFQILKADPRVSAIVGGRIFAGKLQQDVKFPAVLYRSPPEGGREVVRTLEGGCSLTKQIIHVFSSVKGNYGQAQRLDSVVIRSLDEYRGTVTDITASPPDSIEVLAIFMTRLAHAYEYDDKLELHTFVTEFECHFLDPLKAD